MIKIEPYPKPVAAFLCSACERETEVLNKRFKPRVCSWCGEELGK